MQGPRRRQASFRRARGAALAVALATGALACGGGEPESEFPWEEEVVYEDQGPAPAPHSYEEEEDRPSRAGAASGHYGRRPRERASAGAIYAPRKGVFCDEEVESCYTTKGGHVGMTEDQFGVEAGQRLDQRLDEGARASRGVFRPRGGVVCDRASEVCYDREGASLELTREEFGHGAADALVARIDRRRSSPGAKDGRIYTPRRGVWCDRKVDACYIADEAHRGWTKREFGSEAMRSVEHRMEDGRKRRDGIYRAEGGGVCDRLAQVCYDRQGASARLTREEFGRDAASRLAERLE